MPSVCFCPALEGSALCAPCSFIRRAGERHFECAVRSPQLQKRIQVYIHARDLSCPIPESRAGTSHGGTRTKSGACICYHRVRSRYSFCPEDVSILAFWRTI